MTDIERLEKFIRQREKWRYWATPRETTDLQVLRRKDRIMWEAMFLAGLCLFYIIGEPHFIQSAYLSVAAFILGLAGYLVVGASRTASLREIFERTAIQNASDLIDELKRRDAASASQDQPASGSGPRSSVPGLPPSVPSGQGENTADIERLEKFIRRREKWNKWATPQEWTDLQALRKQENAMCEAIIMFTFSLFTLMDSSNFFEPYHLILRASILGFIVYLGMEADRISKLREVFERTAVQNASDLIDELKTRDAASAPQDKPAS